MASGWKLLYFRFPTRGEQLRLLFKIAKQPFEDVRLDFPSGILPYKHAALGDASPLLFDQCPTVTSPEGVHISQTPVAMAFVGRRLKLAPQDDALDARALSLAMFSEEIRNGVFYKLFFPSVICMVLQKKWFGILGCFGSVVNLCCGTGKVRRSLRPKLELLESALGYTTGFYFCGDELCYADVALFDCVRECLAMPGFNRAEELQGLPKLSAFLDRLEEHPVLKPYLAERGTAVDYVVAFALRGGGEGEMAESAVE